MSIVTRLGRWTLSHIEYILDLSALFLKSIQVFFKRHSYGRKVVWKNTVKQILFTGVDGMPVIGTVSALLGMVIIIQAYTLLPALGDAKLISSILVLVIVRELGPILTAFIVIGRSGTALATEIGNMMVSHEVDALKSMGIDPIRFLVAPRLFGMILSMIMLGIYFDLIGLLGGFLVAQLQISLPLEIFARQLFEVMTLDDLIIGLAKNTFFGISIAVVSCYQGMQVQLARTEVPQKTTKAVVSSIFFCFFFNALLTAVFYI